MMNNQTHPMHHAPLYLPQFEHDACGIGFVARINGKTGSDILNMALVALGNQAHRGAVAADANTGDGSGVLTQIPRALIMRDLERQGIHVQPHDIAVGMLFLPRDMTAAEISCRIVQQTLSQRGLITLGWRDVPTNDRVLGQRARETKPRIRQVIVGRSPNFDDQSYERTLFLARKDIEAACKVRGLKTYIPSLSCRTIVYKGLLVGTLLASFYLDLHDPVYETAIAVYHQRYSTNTFPTWERAQPFRMVSHNGEINTIQGNINWTSARQSKLHFPPVPGTRKDGSIDIVTSIIDEQGSDSAMFDNALEVLVLGGRDIRHAMAMMAPEAWEHMPDMSQPLRDFYQYHACILEPWDGPAALTFCDGHIVGTMLDRNGLRPARYCLTEDGLIMSGSEAGVVPVEDRRIICKGRLGPGQMIAVDTCEGRFFTNEEIKHTLASQQPYGTWIKQHLQTLETFASTAKTKHISELSAHYFGGYAWKPRYTVGLEASETIPMTKQTHEEQPKHEPPSLVAMQIVFGYTQEDVSHILKPMVRDGREPVGSMGNDTPLTILSRLDMGYPLFNFFKQRFAEVTNPPIDPLREGLVMSLSVRLGARLDVLQETPAHAHLLQLPSPILTDQQLALIRENHDPLLRTTTISSLMPITQGKTNIRVEMDLRQSIQRICHEAEQAVYAGAKILIISDRGVDVNHTPIPSLLALSAIHHHLIRTEWRGRVSLIVESGEPRDVHHVACLIGYGAKAINPYLALATARAIASEQRDVTLEEAEQNLILALEKGILKIMSKMGISPIESYCGAQIFEAIGLSKHLIDQCFTGTPSRIGGIGYDKIARDMLARHRAAFLPLGAKDFTPKLTNPGFYKFKKAGEYHTFNPDVIRALHHAVFSKEHEDNNAGLDSEGKISPSGYARYQVYANLVNTRPPSALRDLLDFAPSGSAIPLDEVEPIEAIVRRFSTAAVSHGAISSEAHETMTIAMNRLGGMGNSGEGGEAVERYDNERNSRIKQIASGRFGVTPHYLMSASELQIKMAQGSKPGEGGHLPGHKVTAEIAKIRHTTPGVPLISPPPHHDIYSIEDLAQLIYDLKYVNPQACVSVKLVAQAGVGTIAAGVAKGHADVILISGDSGGTGASPLSSIKHAGMPWELGLAETQQTLMLNGLRGRIRLRTDGGLQTGRDVVIAAMLGSDEFSFGTIAMVAEGCKMARVCHNNTCPVGIATQRCDLRKKFPGKPETVMAFFRYMAQEIREILASIGLHSLEQAIGRADLLIQRRTGESTIDALDLSPLLAVPNNVEAMEIKHKGMLNSLPEEQTLDDRIMYDARHALAGQGKIALAYTINNRDRTVGARISGAIAQQYGEKGLPADAIRINLFGSIGQSFGAFNAPGLTLHLIGEANDYVGKGMAGGRIAIYPPEQISSFVWHENVIAGNTILYGATGGEVYLAGRAGERFAVRNSGAIAVVEGIGDHGCEYMTGGVVLVLGETGYNFGAGMTGGVAFVLDEHGHLPVRTNSELVQLDRLNTHEEVKIQTLLRNHREYTGSPRAAQILEHWDFYHDLFWRVMPKEMAAKIEASNEGQEEAHPRIIHPHMGEHALKSVAGGDTKYSTL